MSYRLLLFTTSAATTAISAVAVPTVAAVGSVTLATSTTPAPPSVATTSAVGAEAATDTALSVSPVATVSTVGLPAVLVVISPAPSTVASSTSIGTPSFVTSSQIPVAAVATSSAVQAPLALAGVDFPPEGGGRIVLLTMLPFVGTDPGPGVEAAAIEDGPNIEAVLPNLVLLT